MTATLPAPVNRLFPASAEAAPPDTARINAVIAACSAVSKTSNYASPAVVRLSASGSNVSFLAGPLSMMSGVTLLIDPGVTLYASRNAYEYDLTGSPNKCGTIQVSSSYCAAFITSNGSTSNNVRNIAFMGPGTIDGRGDIVFTLAPPATNAMTWWALAAQAGTMPGKNQNNPRLIQLNSSNGVTFYRINLRNSPKFHVATTKVTNFTMWASSIMAPGNSRNTDGVDPSGTNFTIDYNYISVGDDDVALKAGNGPASYFTIAHNHFYTGHGMSIGSETNAGSDHVLVTDLTEDGTDNGLRIKSDSSRGGVVNATYQAVCMRNVPNPLVFSAYYSSSTGTLYPNFSNIQVHNVHSGPPAPPVPSQGGPNLPLVFQGYKATYPLVITLDNVIVDNVAPREIYASDSIITKGPGPVNFTPVGTDVTVYDNVANANPPLDCTHAFVPFVQAANVCDVNNDGKIDSTDVSAVLAARGTVVGRYDPRNPTGTGTVSVVDARQCAVRCTNANCAP